MKRKGVLCDTSFFIRLLDKNDNLHSHAKSYFKYFLENDFDLYISTIAIAEYCIGGDIQDLPLRNLQIVPFNLDHAIRTSEFARLIFRKRQFIEIKERQIIPNDTKLFAQADIVGGVEYYISSDSESKKIYGGIHQELSPKFQFLDLKLPHHEAFGLLNFE